MTCNFVIDDEGDGICIDEIKSFEGKNGYILINTKSESQFRLVFKDINKFHQQLNRE